VYDPGEEVVFDECFVLNLKGVDTLIALCKDCRAGRREIRSTWRRGSKTK